MGVNLNSLNNETTLPGKSYRQGAGRRFPIRNQKHREETWHQGFCEKSIRWKCLH